jgi:hypothetical protein
LDTSSTNIYTTPKKVALVLITKAVKVNPRKKSDRDEQAGAKADITKVFARCLIESMPVYLNFSKRAKQIENYRNETVPKLKNDLRSECTFRWRKFSD